MRLRTPGWFSWLAICAPLLSPAAIARAADHFLTIGGGYSPSGNQVSLEKNVIFFQGLLSEQYPAGAEHDVFFSDGDDSRPDVQYREPASEAPRANQLVAQVFQSENETHYYRNHLVPQAAGGTSLANVRGWFDRQAPQLAAGDRLFIYVTAHGSRSKDKNAPYDTGLMLWNDERLAMTEMAALLDKVDPAVPVVVVMVQCYAGGFSHLLFSEGDAEKGCSPANRCGFFATVHDRPAAGCTPDIDEENYREYSSSFWAAIRGQTRTGGTIAECDYDGDGQISFEEAHAFALLDSPTIDISIKTSDAFLRQYSRLDPPLDTLPARRDSVSEDASVPPLQPLSANSPYEQLLAAASPVDRAVLEGLSQELALTGSDRTNHARVLAEETTRRKKQLGREIRRTNRELTGICKSIKHDLVARWPEIEDRGHPRFAEILSNEAGDVTALIESHANYGSMVDLAGESQRLGDEKQNFDRRWAKSQRLIRTLENVALAHNLPLVAAPEIQRRYKQLLASERGLFGQQPVANLTASTAP